MVELSEHTKLINIIATLATSKNFAFENTVKENPLWKLGYRLSYIEFPYRGVKPDVVLTSRKLAHSLVVDCKKNRVNANQVLKYVDLKENPTTLLNFVTVDSPVDYYIDPVFLSFHSTLCSDNNVITYEIPVLVVSSKTEKKHLLQLECNDFVAKRIYRHLHNVFPLELPDHIVKSYLRAYYIDPTLNDSAECEFFVNKLLSAIISMIVTTRDFPITIAIEDLSKKIYHQFWDYISYDKKREIRIRIKNIVRKLLKKTKARNKIKLENNRIHISIDPNNENAVRNFANQLKRAKKSVVSEICQGKNTLAKYMK